jgi:sporulation protein YabP
MVPKTAEAVFLWSDSTGPDFPGTLAHRLETAGVRAANKRCVAERASPGEGGRKVGTWMDATPLNHRLELQARRTLTIHGVKHVDRFDDDAIVLVTEMGPLTIRGRNLRIHHLDLDRGEFTAEGDVDALAYTQRSGTAGRHPLQRLWR